MSGATTTAVAALAASGATSKAPLTSGAGRNRVRLEGGLNLRGFVTPAGALCHAFALPLSGLERGRSALEEGPRRAGATALRVARLRTAITAVQAVALVEERATGPTPANFFGTAFVHNEQQGTNLKTRFSVLHAAAAAFDTFWCCEPLDTLRGLGVGDEAFASLPFLETVGTNITLRTLFLRRFVAAITRAPRFTAHKSTVSFESSLSQLRVARHVGRCGRRRTAAPEGARLTPRPRTVTWAAPLKAAR